MIIKNVIIFTKDKTFVPGSIVIKDGIITRLIFKNNENNENNEIDYLKVVNDNEIIDGDGCYAIPGLIDSHFHGCMGADFCDGDITSLETIAGYEATVGVTAIAPATLTLPKEKLIEILNVAASYNDEKKNNCNDKADIVGINMEGPFISQIKKGAQDERYIIKCDKELSKKFIEASKGLVKIIGLAPDTNSDFKDFINDMKDDVIISLAHTNADYDVAKKAFNSGASRVTHLFNAMPDLLHREPGIIGAALENENVMVELICDGLHVHPSVINATFKMFGASRIIMISDSIRATGMKDGTYMLGGLDVLVNGNKAVTKIDGSLAGSVTNLMECLKIAVKEANVSLIDAVVASTINPAKSLGIYDKYGSLENGKYGNVVLLDKSLNMKCVIKRGNLIDKTI